MNSHPPVTFDGDAPQDRLDPLLVDRALGELSPEDAVELGRLLAFAPSGDLEAFDRLAAVIELGSIGPELDPLPEALRHRILTASRATREAPHVQTPTDPAPAMPRNWAQWVIHFAPTLAAAAILLVAFALWPHDVGSSKPISLVTARQGLLDRAADVIQLPWTTTDDPAAKGASGDVVWSDSAQSGYMRFAGLPTNDPRRSQYQLWIFDAARNASFPVDGGVFDIDTSGAAIIPITAKLHVQHPTLFAITIEPPGGVVVSDRKRLPLLAKPAAK